MKQLLHGHYTGSLLLCFVLLMALYGCSNPPVPAPPEGEFSRRMKMTEERLTGDIFEPVFTNEFILADVNLDPVDQRRFQNYSGDLSGRFVEALSACTGDEYDSRLDEIVKEILKYQQPDGRFGDPLLLFSEEKINKEHMPLLWGNGRLLVGLLEYYSKTGNKDVLVAAIKLGDFFTGCYREVTPEVVKRLEGLGADGIICFTQYVEPLVMLSQITGDKKYAEVAKQVYPVLPERGTLHSHGYLTTLRGVLKLYEYEHDPAVLDYVSRAYNSLINSEDHTLYGSVKEYFGGKGDRDEGCSTADFIRLSLNLYKLTGEMKYLEKAEFALYNSLYFNQYFTGDFGHHTIDNTESPSELMMAAWWCCTMSGLRAMQVLRDEYFIENNNEHVKVNLLLDADYSDDSISISLSRKGYEDGFHDYELHIIKATSIEKPLMIRKPSWADEAVVLINGVKKECNVSADWVSIAEDIGNGDRITLKLKYATRVIADGKELRINEIDAPVSGVLCYGPNIMAVDNKTGYTFLAEPDNNEISINTFINSTEDPGLNDGVISSSVSNNYLTARYRHDGYPSNLKVILRPVSEMTFDGHPYMKVLLNYVPENDSK